MAKPLLGIAFLALFVSNGFVEAAVPPKVDKYLRLCEEKRISRIFKRRESLAVLQKKLDAMDRPETAEETRVRDELLKEMDALREELKLLEDFTKQIHPLADVTRSAIDSTVSTGDLFYRNYYGARRFVVTRIVDAKHLIAESYLDRKDAAPQKYSPLIMIEMPTAKVKVGDSIEPAGAWNVTTIRDPANKNNTILSATPLDLRPYERHAAAIRKASLVEFHKREQEWLKKQQQLQDAADADPKQ